MKFKIIIVCILLLIGQSNLALEDIHDKAILLKNATIIDMVSETGRKGDVLITNDTITEINYSDSIQAPKGAITYDLTGKYIIPGLIDNHVHITHGTYNDAVKELDIALKNGITGVRDMGGDGRMLAQLQRAALIDEIPAPDVYFSAIIAGPFFFEKDPRPASVALGAEVGNVPWQWAIDENTDYEDIISQTRGLGATAIKVYARVDQASLNKVAAEARKQGLKVWAHGSIPPLRPSDIIDAKPDVVSHAGAFIGYELADEVLDRYSFDSRDTLDGYRQALKFIPFNANTPKVMALFEKMRKNKTILDATLWVYTRQGRPANEIQHALKVTRLAHQAGVMIGAGTDGLNHDNGYVSNIHEELALLTQAGLSPLEALKAATIHNAIGLGQENSIGTIEQGKVANLVVLGADPLVDITNTRSVETVIKRGKPHAGYSSTWFNPQNKN